MAINPEFIYKDSEIHLRDARHAHNFYTQNSYAFSPKVPFLYHVVFGLRGLTVANQAPNTDKFKKQIAVMAKEVDLPSFRAEVDTKQQYNRKKHIQTRIDYDEVRLVFHDDNVGATRSLLEEYYRYYFKDGNKNDGAGFPLGFNPRDKYNALDQKYGLDNDTNIPFFYYIKIFQLSRQKWFSYTLVNPILTSWNHDTLNYGGEGTLENTINVMYEAVLYNSGDIGENSDPAGFADAETAYDQIHSPLTTQTKEFNQSVFGAGSGAVEVGLQSTSNVPSGITLFNAIQNATQLPSTLSQIVPQIGTGLQDILFPITNLQSQTSTSKLSSQSAANKNTNELTNFLLSNQSALESTTKKSLASGFLNNNFNVNNFSDFDNLADAAKEALFNEVLEKINVDPRIVQIASQILS